MYICARLWHPVFLEHKVTQNIESPVHPFYPKITVPFGHENNFQPSLSLSLSLFIPCLLVQGRMRDVNRNSNVPYFVRRVELVQRRSIMYYQQQNSQPFLKIVVALPTMVTSCRG